MISVKITKYNIANITCVSLYNKKNEIFSKFTARKSNRGGCKPNIMLWWLFANTSQLSAELLSKL